MHYRVTLSDVLAAHDEALEFGGRPGVISLDSIQSAIGRPYSGYHRPIAQKAAALMHGLIQNHGFVDGNKRTSLIVVLLLIKRSGYHLKLQDGDRIDDIVVAVADGQMTFDMLCTWFKSRLARLF